MHPRVKKLPQPVPDFHRFLQVVRRERPDRVPLIELAIHPEVVAVLLDEPAVARGNTRPDEIATIEPHIRLQHRLGYDVVKVAAPIPWDVQRLAGHDASQLSTSARNWLDEHRGPIGSREEFEQFNWPRPQDVNFRPLENATKILRDGMKIVAFSGGVLEFSMDLVGMERLMLATHRDPELVAAVIDRVGQTIYNVFETYCQMESVCALWLGDDLGHKHGLLISPKVLRQHVFPWYRRFADLAHEHDRPFLLHTCGNTATIMPTLVDEVGIDAKHSFEDAIQPVEQFYDQWHEKIAVLGGVDLHLLSVGDEPAIRQRTLAILEHCAPGGGYAAGSGNSIPNYVGPEKYLAMLEAVAEFNERA
jgi:uroporphyrinogen decarboxylase